MKSLTGPILKSLIFIVVTVLATVELALTITNGTSGDGASYSAIFTDATSVQAGDDVRIAGVRVGQVDSVDIHDRTQAQIGFTLDSGVTLAKTVTATIRYRNLIGQRYIALDEGSGSLADPLRGGSTIGVEHTTPALDLTVLFNGFQPLFQALSPTEVNELSASVISVFQGEGGTITDLLSQTGQLTNTLADKDEVIKKVIDNLNTVLGVLNQSDGTQLGNLITTLSTFVQGFAQDHAALGSALSGIGALTTDVADLFGRSRGALQQSITSLEAVSANLAGSSGALNSFLQTLPGKLNTIGRIASYGSWLNFYVCSINGIKAQNVPSGYGNVPTTQYPAPPGVSPYPTITVGPANPTGLVGVDPVAARCNG